MKLLTPRFALLGSALAVLLLATAAHAQNTVQIQVQPSARPISVLGMIISKRGVLTQPIGIENLKPLTTGGFIVPVALTSEISSDAFVTALVVQEDKGIVMGDVRPATAASTPSYHTLPDCPPERAETGDVPGKLGLLDSLVKLRTDLREKYLAELQKQLTPDLVARLTRLEELFGIKQHPPLSADLPPAILADRLSRLMEAVNNYRAYSGSSRDGSEKN